MGWKDQMPEEGVARGRAFSATDGWWYRFTQQVQEENRSEYIRMAVEKQMAADQEAKGEA